jgi:hypothetical protein
VKFIIYQVQRLISFGNVPIENSIFKCSRLKESIGLPLTKKAELTNDVGSAF